jgi:hypothetical protein
MTSYVGQAFWILIAVFIVSLFYKLYRVTAKKGASMSDTKRSIVTGSLPLWAVIIASAVLVRTGWLCAVWTGLILSLVLIGLSIFYCNPTIMRDRKPGPIDWLEDMFYTGLLFVEVALLIYHLAGITLTP